MMSYDVQDHGASDHLTGQAKKPWVTPSVQIIALESAEHGGNLKHDGTGGHFNRTKS
jgi:hypothetical protein